MLRNILKIQKLLGDLTVLIDAQMPEAQRKLDRGEEWDFDRVTAQLRKCAAIETALVELIAVETGNPSFGLSSRMSDEELERAWQDAHTEDA
jgi:hypothetical protein